MLGMLADVGKLPRCRDVGTSIPVLRVIEPNISELKNAMAAVFSYLFLPAANV
jgi:hypothetical protein